MFSRGGGLAVGMVLIADCPAVREQAPAMGEPGGTGVVHLGPTLFHQRQFRHPLLLSELQNNESLGTAWGRRGWGTGWSRVAIGI